ncbi:hypothetical protein G9C85_11420 [Halorubellus sp. JP-L1]|uniref:DUF7519 family protein n=1 Tax=Halorubellus sp. JP-L1 TaxID=2715753 RepID=UPI00140A763B|nr:hypothetical protein [Halorubellus sp. JP-L1]NHN42230.1 hypothetical protein [Halorubellus sp. JP-L1]
MSANADGAAEASGAAAASGETDATGGGDSGDGGDDLSAREIDRRPTPLSAVVALAAAAITAIAASVGSPAGGALAAVGVAVLAPAVVRGSRWLVHVAGLVLLAGVVLGGAGDAPELWILTATVGAVVAWDAGQNAISLGEQLGRDADTARAEVAHSAATIGLGATTVGVAYVLYQFAGGNRPLSAVVLLLVAVAVLLNVLR